MKKLSVRGDIIHNNNKWAYDWLGMDATCPADITKGLQEADGEEVEVDINSGGGNIFAGSEIYTLLRSYKGEVTINILGLAASAASVIAMAGKSKISPTALIMMHNVSGSTSGDHRAHEHKVALLQEADQAIANAYKAKTGLSDMELLSIMNAETWMNAETAVRHRFVDEVMFQSQNTPILYNGVEGIKEETIHKLRGLVEKPKVQEYTATAILLAKYDYLSKVRK